MRRVQLAVVLSLALGMASCAGGGFGGGGSGSAPETLSGTFELVRIDGQLQPLGADRPQASPAAAACGTPAGPGAGYVRFGGEDLTFRLSVVQRDACTGEVRRSEGGRYIRHGEHLVLEAPVGGSSHTRFRATTNDTTLTLRLTGAELHFRRTGS